MPRVRGRVPWRHLSELIDHGVRRRPGRKAIDPVASRLGIAPPPQRIAAANAHDKRCWNEHRSEHQEHHDRVRDTGQEQAKLRTRLERRREGEGWVSTVKYRWVVEE